jgi:polyisoprenoid-binding protein YceI
MGENESVPVRYLVDASRSRFIVRASATGLLSAFAHNPTIAIREFTGGVLFNPDSPETSALELTIKPGSLELTDEVSDKDRREIERQMREDVLETARFTEIVFESTNASVEKIMEGQHRARINGKLSLHGVTRDCEIGTQLIVGGDMLRAHGEFSLRQSDFNIKQISAAGGTIKVKDELKFSFDIVARKQ